MPRKLCCTSGLPCRLDLKDTSSGHRRSLERWFEDWARVRYKRTYRPPNSSSGIESPILGSEMRNRLDDRASRVAAGPWRGLGCRRPRVRKHLLHGHAVAVSWLGDGHTRRQKLSAHLSAVHKRGRSGTRCPHARADWEGCAECDRNMTRTLHICLAAYR
jgi:hypothetical protein